MNTNSLINYNSITIHSTNTVHDICIHITYTNIMYKILFAYVYFIEYVIITVIQKDIGIRYTDIFYQSVLFVEPM